MSLISDGLRQGLIKIDPDKKFVTYVHPSKKYRFSDPEEQVRVEVFLQLILEYKYPANRIDLEVTVPRRTPNDHADIVVYNDDEKKSPFIIVECKKQEVSEAEFVQAIEQGFGNANSLAANYIWITSYIKSNYYDLDKKKYPAGEREDNKIASIPRFGQKQLNKARFYFGSVDENNQPAFDIKKLEQDELTRVFTQAHQALWGGGKRNPSEAFDELDKLIFCKIWDEKKPRKKGQPYDFQEFSGEPSETLLRRIKNIYEEGRKKDPEVFKDDIRLTPNELKTIVGYLASINLSDTDLDSKGRAFETFMGSFFRGDFGQYFTPREVVDFIVKVLPIENESLVLDTSCGSGGFLLYALDKIRKKADEYYPDQKGDSSKGIPEGKDHYKYWHDFAERNLFGIEINEQIARTAKMNMIIHDDGHTNVISFDGLSESKEIISKSGNKNFTYNIFDYIITNPPFGSAVKQTEQAYLRNYKLAVKDVSWINRKLTNAHLFATVDSQSTEVLFIEQCYNFLKPGGILAIVIPDGLLTNSSQQHIRNWIEEHYRLISVVSLPDTAFMANNANVKSSVLFLQKLTLDQIENILSTKHKLQDNLWDQSFFSAEIQKLIQVKNNKIENLEGFSLNQTIKDKLNFETTSLSSLTKQQLNLLKATEEFKSWRKEITEEYKDLIEEVKENLQDEYLEKLKSTLFDYPILMAITEDIGYDAAGRKTNKNELDNVSAELTKFIHSIREGTDHFFV